MSVGQDAGGRRRFSNPLAVAFLPLVVPIGGQVAWPYLTAGAAVIALRTPDHAAIKHLSRRLPTPRAKGLAPASAVVARQPGR